MVNHVDLTSQASRANPLGKRQDLFSSSARLLEFASSSISCCQA
jgi:hypothetical protein